MPSRQNQDRSSVNAPVDRHRRDNIVQDTGHDPYREGEHLPDPSVCPTCRATYHAGRWSWRETQEPRREHLCPPCKRIRDRYPAGSLDLSGPFFLAHRDEILGLVKNVAALESAEHPLHRIMELEATTSGLLITTTDTHLPRRIGEALADAYNGELVFRYADEDAMLRATWCR